MKLKLYFVCQVVDSKSTKYPNLAIKRHSQRCYNEEEECVEHDALNDSMRSNSEAGSESVQRVSI